MTVDPHADALRSFLEHAGGRDGILRLQRGDDGTGVEAERRDLPGRKFQEDQFVLRAKDVDLADVWDRQNFCANVFDPIAQLPLGQTVAGEGVDVAEDVAEAVVEAGTYDPLRKIALDVRNHVADARPGRRNVGSLRRVAQIDEDGGLARNGDALGIVERLQLFELLLDPVGDLARHFLGRSARPLRPDHHGLDGEIRIFLPPQLQVGEQTRRHEGDHEVPDERTMAECPVGKVEGFHGVASCSNADLLSWFEAVDSGSHDARSGGETAGDPDASFVLGKVDLVQRNRARRSVDDPDESLGALFEDGGCGHAENWLGIVAQPRGDGASEPKVFGRIIQGDANAAHARHLIGLRRNFANLALDLNGGKQLQADGERQTDGQGHGEVRADIDHSLPDVRPRHGHDTLTRRRRLVPPRRSRP